MASAISGGNRKRHQRCDRQQNGEELTSRVRLGQHHRQRAEVDEPELQADILADGTGPRDVAKRLKVRLTSRGSQKAKWLKIQPQNI